MQIPNINSIFSARMSDVRGRMPVGFDTAFSQEYDAATAADTTAQAADTAAQAATPTGSGLTDEMIQMIQASGSGNIDLSGLNGALAAGNTGTAGTGAIDSLDDLLALLNSLQGTGTAGTTAGAAMGQNAATYAQQFVGTPYVWGGEDLVKGADCSGFTQSVYAKYGIKLARTAYGQSKQGTVVSLDELRPGDLLCYKTADYAPVTHVGMYIGDNKFIHASSAKEGVVISDLNARWRNRLITARRVTGA